MDAAAGSGRGVSLSQSLSRKEWRVVSENPVRISGNEDLERSKMGHSDERTIYEVQQHQDAIDAAEFCSIQIDGVMGVDDGILQQRIHSLARQREELQRMEVDFRAQMFVKSEILQMQNTFEARLNEQSNITNKLQEQLREREQTIHVLERKMEEKERELHATRVANEAAWAKDDLLREQDNELANFRRERDNVDAERNHHLKQIHELQELIQDKERQFLELQEQHRVAQENISYKDEQLRDAQAWMARVQEIDGLQSSTLQVELQERTEQYNQLWLGFQRQFAEMERVHMQTIQQLQHELIRAGGKSGAFNTESIISRNILSNGSQNGPSNGSHSEANGGGSTNENSGILANGNATNSQAFISSGVASTQTSRDPSLSISPPILGMPSFLPTGQVAALHPYVMHQGTNHSVPSHVPQSHDGHFPSVPAMTSYQQWQNQQAVSESPLVSSQIQQSLSQNEENLQRSDPNFSYEYPVNGSGLHSEYLNVHLNQGLDHKFQMSSAEEAQTLESVKKSNLVDHETQQSLQQISSQFREALHLESFNQNSEIQAQENNVAHSGPEGQDVMSEQTSSAASPPSEASNHTVHYAEGRNNAADTVLSEEIVSTGHANSMSTGKVAESALLDERTLLACIVRTIPPGGNIRISSTLLNRLGKMLAPRHWHDYRMKYGKLDDFVASHPELFLIEGDYIQLRDGAQGIVAATAAVAKVAAAAAASSSSTRHSSFFPSVAVTPMAHPGRVMQNHHRSNGSRGHSNVRILSKSNNHSEFNSTELRPGQSLILPAENGLHSVRSGLVNLQTQARPAASFVGKQSGRINSAQLASRR